MNECGKLDARNHATKLSCDITIKLKLGYFENINGLVEKFVFFAVDICVISA